MLFYLAVHLYPSTAYLPVTFACRMRYSTAAHLRIKGDSMMKKSRRLPCIVATLVALLFIAGPTQAEDNDRSEMRKHFKEKMFSKLDSNEDNSISKEEFLTAHQARAEKRFTAIDTDGDGVVTKEEFEQFKPKKHWKKKAWKKHQADSQ